MAARMATSRTLDRTTNVSEAKMLKAATTVMSTSKKRDDELLHGEGHEEILVQGLPVDDSPVRAQARFHGILKSQGQHRIGEAHLHAEDGLAGVTQALGVLKRNEGQACVVLLKAEGGDADHAEEVGARSGLEAAGERHQHLNAVADRCVYPVGQVATQNEAPDHFLASAVSLAAGAGGRLVEVVDRALDQGPSQFRHALGNFHTLEVGANLANHHLAGREAKARGAHQAWKTSHLGADFLRFALGFVNVALKPVGGHDEMGVDGLDLFLEFALEPAGHGQHDDQRGHAEHHAHRRDGGENREQAKKQEEDRGQQGDQRDDHGEGFQSAVMAARGQDDGEVHHRACQGDKRAQPHDARLGFPAQVARAHESFEAKPEEQRKAGEQGQ